jgi:hypothetical protein
VTMDKPNPSIRFRLFSSRNTLLRGWLTEPTDRCRHRYRDSKKEVSSLIYVVYLQKPLKCYHCSKLRSVIVTVRLKV